MNSGPAAALRALREALDAERSALDAERAKVDVALQAAEDCIAESLAAGCKRAPSSRAAPLPHRRTAQRRAPPPGSDEEYTPSSDGEDDEDDEDYEDYEDDEAPAVTTARPATDCGQCPMCLDKPKFGGPGIKRKACLNLRAAGYRPPAAAAMCESVMRPPSFTPSPLVDEAFTSAPAAVDTPPVDADGAIMAYRDLESEGSALDLFDVFSGGGLFAYGAKAGGMRPIAGVDSDGDMLWYFKNNLPRVPFHLAAIGPAEGWTAFTPPAPRAGLHAHFSPPGRGLSKSCRGKGAHKDEGPEMLRWSLNEAVKYQSFSVDTICSAETKAVCAEVAAAHSCVAYAEFDAVDFGVPQTRKRLIISTPAILTKLHERPAEPQVSVKAAFAKAGVAIPRGATHVKNSSLVAAASSACKRSIEHAAFTCCAGRALSFCRMDGTTVQSMVPDHTKVLMGLPGEFQLRGMQRLDQQALGAGVAFGLAKAIAEAAVAAHRDSM